MCCPAQIEFAVLSPVLITPRQWGDAAGRVQTLPLYSESHFAALALLVVRRLNLACCLSLCASCDCSCAVDVVVGWECCLRQITVAGPLRSSCDHC